MRTKLQVAADRAAEEKLRTTANDLRHLREDAGLPRTAVARAAGIHPSYLRLIELGLRDASVGTLCRVSAALGADVGLRIFPSTGPMLRDRIQSRMIEALLQMLPPDWTRYLEVAVHRPVRGVIDLVLARASTFRVVSIEAHSDIRRLEQQIRWAAEKTDALPTATVWPVILDSVGAKTLSVSRILLLRSTASTRAIARSFATTLATAYPADPAAVRAALLDPRLPWPGNGILWAKVDGEATTILRASPRGVPRP